MKNKKGFISMTLVYSFLTLFLFIMAGILASQTEKSNYVDFINEKVNEDLRGLNGKTTVLYNRILEDNASFSGSVFTIGNIANNSVGNGNGLYFVETPDVIDENRDGITDKIFYFRGSATTNYVKISNMCFRIIRTNEDGSIRMMYSGTSCATNGTAVAGIGVNKFNSLSNDNAYVGYMYGKPESIYGVFRNRFPDAQRHSRYMDTHNYYTQDYTVINKVEVSTGLVFENIESSSNAKKVVENWFKTHLSQYDIFTDAYYCGDRSLTNAAAQDSRGFGSTSTTDYGAARYWGAAAKNVSFVCSQIEDAYQLSKYSGGYREELNSLNYPVGLPTFADIIYAGGSTSTDNKSYYMYTGNAYWTMSPYSYSTAANEVIVNANGRLSAQAVNAGSTQIYPVISVKPDVVVSSGNGTQSSPYVLKLN